MADHPSCDDSRPRWADWCERELARGPDRKAEFGEERDSGPGKAKSLAQVIGMRNDVLTRSGSVADTGCQVLVSPDRGSREVVTTVPQVWTRRLTMCYYRLRLNEHYERDSCDVEASRPVILREFSDAELPMVQERSADPYVPLMGTLPPNATRQEALDYTGRQRRCLAEGIGFSFAIAEAGTGRGVGGIGLWLAGLDNGRATAGFSVTPSERGPGFASDTLTALTCFAGTIPELHRIELYIEPWNTRSVKTAERAGFEREGLLRSHQEIGGHRRDMLLYAAIKEDPPAQPPAAPRAAI
jgi:ribosomal-protein-alanine N-acetyltransferase